MGLIGWVCGWFVLVLVDCFIGYGLILWWVLGLGGVGFVVGLLFVIGADWVPRWIGFVLLLVLFDFTV